MRVTRSEAVHALQMARVPISGDFHQLRSTQVEALLAEADRMKYRKPKNANGSRARYFHDFLQRKAAKSIYGNPRPNARVTVTVAQLRQIYNAGRKKKRIVLRSNPKKKTPAMIRRAAIRQIRRRSRPERKRTWLKK